MDQSPPPQSTEGILKLLDEFGFHLPNPWLVVVKFAARDHQEVWWPPAVSHSGDCPFLLPCWVYQLASVPLGMVCKPKRKGKTAAHSQEETDGFESSCEAAPLSKPQFQRRKTSVVRKGDPHDILQQDKCERCWKLSLLHQHQLQAQHGMAACGGTPQLLTIPQRAPKKHLLLLIACLAEVLGYPGGAAARLKVPGHSTEQG